MKKVIIISLFVLGLIIPNINVKAVDVSNEEELRAAIADGGDINLTDDIEVTQPLVIDKDVNIDGDWNYNLMQGDNTLMTINSGNVTLNKIYLYAGMNYESYNVVKNQGTTLVVNGGNVNFASVYIHAGKLGLEVNDGSVTGSLNIYAGEHNDDTETYLGGQGMVVNGGNAELNSCYIYSGGTALTLNKDSNVTLNNEARITSYEENGIEVNDGGVIHIIYADIDSQKNAIYLNGGTANLNGGTANLNGKVSFKYGESYYAIYINKGKNTVTNDSSFSLGKNLIFIYGNYGYLQSLKTPSIYVNPEISEVKVTDEKNFFHYENNKLKLDFCSNNASASNTDSEEGTGICTNIGGHYDGPIYTNELGKCTVVYVNGVKQNEENSSCNPASDNKNEPSQIVNVPATSAYASIIIITLGILCVIVSVIVTRRVTKKAKSN